MTEMLSNAQAAAPRPRSRYVRVRRAQSSEQPENAPPPTAPVTARGSASPKFAPASAPKNESIARSMSRYKKNRPRAPTSAQNASVPTTPILTDGAHDSSFASNGDSVGASPFSPYQPAQESFGSEHRSMGYRGSATQQRNSANHPASKAAQRLSEQQAERFWETPAGKEALAMQAEADERERAESAKMLLEKSMREDLARLEATLEAATAPIPVRGRAESSSRWGKLSSFGRKLSRPRGDKVSPPLNAVVGERSVRDANARVIVGNNVRNDAPKSGAAEGRRVDVSFGSKRRQFSVSKTTTAGDLMGIAILAFHTPFDVDAAVLKESYRSDSLHIERRLRIYELIAPVMNSWDRDTQNELILEASDSPRHDLDLLIRGAPQERPKATSVQLYHSYKRGRWVKNWVTLHSDGQIFISKNKPESGKWVSKEHIGIAHMSDFDMYTLTDSQVKVLKPKRKYNCVVKSQHKQTLYEKSPENFVHFFSTGHAAEYQDWIDACQSWRSWYLSQEAKASTSSAALPVPKSRAYEEGVHGQIDYTKSGSVPHHQSGSYKPLRMQTSFGNIDRYDSDSRERRSSRDYFDDPSDSDNFRSPLSPQTRQVPFHLRNGGGGGGGAFSPPPTTEPFSQGGLLGRSYSQRQKAMHENSPRVMGNADFMSGAFMGHGLLAGAGGGSGGGGGGSRHSTSRNNSPHIHAADFTRRPSMAGSSRRPSMAGSRPGTAGSGKGSVPPMPDLASLYSPLVDVSPVFKEAPQWRGEGRGRGVRVPEGVPLVDAAGSRWEKEGKEYRPEEFRRGG